MRETVTDADLARLPLWAAVAFAARCARQVQLFIKQGWPSMPKNLTADVERAIAIAERCAGQAKGVPNYSPAADADQAGDAQGTAARWAEDKTITPYIDAAVGAAYAADVAGDYVAGASWARHEKVYELVGRALRGATAQVQVQAALSADYARLLQAAQDQQWNDETPVPATFFD